MAIAHGPRTPALGSGALTDATAMLGDGVAQGQYRGPCDVIIPSQQCITTTLLLHGTAPEMAPFGAVQESGWAEGPISCLLPHTMGEMLPPPRDNAKPPFHHKGELTPHPWFWLSYANGKTTDVKSTKEGKEKSTKLHVKVPYKLGQQHLPFLETWLHTRSATVVATP